MSWGRQSASHYNIIRQWLRSEVSLSLTNIGLLRVAIVAHYSIKYRATTGSRG